MDLLRQWNLHLWESLSVSSNLLIVVRSSSLISVLESHERVFLLIIIKFSREQVFSCQTLSEVLWIKKNNELFYRLINIFFLKGKNPTTCKLLIIKEINPCVTYDKVAERSGWFTVIQLNSPSVSSNLTRVVIRFSSSSDNNPLKGHRSR